MGQGSSVAIPDGFQIHETMKETIPGNTIYLESYWSQAISLYQKRWKIFGRLFQFWLSINLKAIVCHYLFSEDCMWCLFTAGSFLLFSDSLSSVSTAMKPCYLMFWKGNFQFSTVLQNMSEVKLSFHFQRYVSRSYIGTRAVRYRFFRQLGCHTFRFIAVTY